MRDVTLLDRPIARMTAGLLFALCVGALAYIHRDDLFPPAAEAVADDPVARCVAERSGQIDTMLRDNLIDASKAALFQRRAEALCANLHGDK